MYNFSGVFYRVWAADGIVILLGIICILITKPWLGFSFKKCAFGMFAILFGIVMSVSHIKGIVSQDVSSHTGEFLRSYRNSRVAPPLPFTMAYVFNNGEGKNQTYYLDVFSAKMILPDEFEEGETYTIYFEEASSVIVKVEKADQSGDGSLVSK